MSKVTLNENRIGAVVRDAARDEIARKLNAGADIWRSLARKDTGFMANAVNTVITVDRHGNPEGHLEFEATTRRTRSTASGITCRGVG